MTTSKEQEAGKPRAHGANMTMTTSKEQEAGKPPRSRGKLSQPNINYHTPHASRFDRRFRNSPHSPPTSTQPKISGAKVF